MVALPESSARRRRAYGEPCEVTNIWAENERTAERLEADARGAARVLSSEFFLAAREMWDFAMDGYFKPFNESYRIETTQEDMRLIASRLSAEQWRYVNLAFSSVQGLERYVEVGRSPTILFRRCHFHAIPLKSSRSTWSTWSEA